MSARSTRSLLAWSLVGLIGGHQATYLAVYHDPALLGGILDATGHGWLSFAPMLVLSGALMAIALGVPGSGPIRSFRWRFAFLAAIQVATFSLVEVAERYTDGIDIGAFLADAWLILAVGAAIQIGVAFSLALASRIVDRVAIKVGRRPAPRRRPRVQAVRPPLITLPTPALPVLGTSPRAPPVRV